MGTPPPTVRETVVALLVVPLYVGAVYAAVYAKDELLPAHAVAALVGWSAWCAFVWRTVRRMEPNVFRTFGVLSAAIPLAILATGMVQPDKVPPGWSWVRLVPAGVATVLVMTAMGWFLTRLDASRGWRRTSPWRWPARGAGDHDD